MLKTEIVENQLKTFSKSIRHNILIISFKLIYYGTIILLDIYQSVVHRPVAI
jgi:hypothetical protein